MIVIAAKIKCDHWDCKKTVDVSLELTFSADYGLPILKVSDQLPEGWSSAYYENDRHHCPKHKDT